jgi:CRP-like cAMP-binding protein
MADICHFEQSPLFRNLTSAGWAPGAHQDILASLEKRRLLAHQDIFVEGDVVGDILLLESGWAYRYCLLDDGRKQIIQFFVPGDFIGPFTRRASSFASTITPADICRLARDRLAEVWSLQPALVAAIETILTRENELFAERMVSLGRRNAKERMAQFLLELQQRLDRVGMLRGDSFPLPLTQEHIGDALGLSVVHVNRTLRTMREEGIATVGFGRATIHDAHGLKLLAGFGYGRSDLPLDSRAILGEVAAKEAEVH